MIRLLNIELKKILSYRVFWAIAGLYLLALVFIFYGFPSLIDYFSLRSNSPEIKLLKNFLYNFPDIWQNLTWVASLRFFVKIMAGIIMIMLVTNEYTFGTLRLSIINGYSRGQFLSGKIALAVFMSLVSTFMVFIAGTVLGFAYSSTVSAAGYFGKIAFLGAYFIELLSFLLMAMMFGILVKRTSLALSLLVVYPIVELIIQQKLSEAVQPFLPMNAINHIIRTPNTSLIQFRSPEFNIDLQTHLYFQDFAIAILYSAFFVLITYIVLKKRDL